MDHTTSTCTTEQQHFPQEIITMSASSNTSTTEQSPFLQRGIRKSVGGCWQRVMKKANASFGSTMTAATSLLGSLDDDFQEHNDDDSLNLGWEGLEDSFLNASSSLNLNTQLHLSEHDNDDDDDDEDSDSVSSSESMDLSQLERLPQHHFIEPYESFHASYDLGASLGEGAFGSVHKCYSKEPINGEELSYAVKAVPMDKYNHEEIEILELLKDCPNIVQVEEVFHDLEESFIVMEEIKGGELLERIVQKKCYAEDEAKVLFKTMLETVKYCHDNGIAHCDIKPENIMLTSKADDTSMKLVDFGLAKRFRNEDGTTERMLEMHGSAEYAAPEVFNRSEDDQEGYDERCDIWSLGVVLYVLLAGYAPFEADGPDEMIKMVGKGKFKFHKHYWKHISRDAKVLIARMMQVDPNKRCTLEQALASPWFTRE